MSSITVEELLEHADWLRQLAYRLVADPATADDLVQETWIAALRRPPVRGRSPRPWLGKVLRNLERNRRRARVRRGDREVLADAAPANPTPEEIAREAEGQRMIAEAVAELAEPHRSVVVLRYFRGLDSRAIGRMRGVSASTIRGQLRHALDELRGRLDREHGGREAWAGFLLPFLPALPTATPTSTLAPAMASTMWLKIALALTALVFIPLIGVQLFSGAGSESASSSEAEVASGPGLPTSPDPAVALEPARGATSPVVAPPNPPSPVPPVTEARASAFTPVSIVVGSEDDPATLRGRFLFPDGSPVVGLTLEILASWFTVDQQPFSGVPEFLGDSGPVTDGEGRFEVSFETPRTFYCGISAKHQDHVLDRWQFRQLQVGTAIDVGTVVLRRPGAIEGTLVREDGSPLTGEAWKAYGKEVIPESSSGRRAISESGEVDRDTGTFRLDDLPPGPVRLQAKSPIAGWIEGPNVQVVSDEKVVAQIIYSGPDNSRRIAIATRNQLMISLGAPGRDSIVLHGAAGGPVTAKPLERAPNKYVFDDLEPGSYEVEIVDPRFQPWSEPNALTGSVVSARLVGSCSLSLRDPSGAPIEPLSVSFECLELTYTPPWLSEWEGLEVVPAMFAPKNFEARADGDYLSGNRLIGLVPGSWRVQVDAGESGTATVEVHDLAPGEERVVEFAPAIDNVSGIAGLVRELDGSPAAAAEVWLLHPAEEDDSPSSLVMYPGMAGYPQTEFRKTVTRTVTTAEGAFAFDHPGAGSYAVLARRTELFVVATEAFPLEAGEAFTDLELTLPAEAVLAGRLVGPPGSSTEGLRVFVAPASMPPQSLPFAMLAARDERDLDATGSFRSQSLPTGEAIPYVKLPANPDSTGQYSSTSSDADGLKQELALDPVQLVAGTNELELQLLEDFPGRLEVTVFAGGGPLAEVEVRLGPAGSFTAWSYRRGYTDPAGGPAKIVDFPGSRSLQVIDEAAGWCYRDPAPVQVITCATNQLQVDVELAKATLTIVDADGESLAGAAIMLTFPEGSGDQHWLGETRTTGADGAFVVTLVPGEYHAYLLALDGSDHEAVKEARRSLYRDDPQLPRATFTWSASGAQLAFD